MDELVKLVAKKTGLSEDLSKKAVEVVIAYLKAKLPAPLDSQIDAVLSGGGQVEGMMKGLGGMLGQK
ncbi:MAG: DUF2267 domain-containing protein [Chloroflexi bacterium]|nr:DUF2267 domain-containing protein [Chloroflexota bacterium]MBU1749432.1 DUF2267 domain-containing protein [Chloroflexota bacterium]